MKVYGGFLSRSNLFLNFNLITLTFCLPERRGRVSRWPSNSIEDPNLDWADRAGKSLSKKTAHTQTHICINILHGALTNLYIFREALKVIKVIIYYSILKQKSLKATGSFALLINDLKIKW